MCGTGAEKIRFRENDPKAIAAQIEIDLNAMDDMVEDDYRAAFGATGLRVDPRRKKEVSLWKIERKTSSGR